MDHVNGAEDAHNHAHDGRGQAHGVQQHDGKHDATGWDARGADGDQGGQENEHGLLSQGEVHAVDLGNEDDGDGVIDGNAVHVDGGPQRQGEGGQLAFDMELLFRHFETDRQGAGTAGGAEGHQPDAGELAEEFRQGNPGNRFDDEQV